MPQPTNGVISGPSAISAREPGASELVRGLGLWSATAAVIGIPIGTGIFLVGSEVARDAGSAELSLAAWVTGGVLSLCGALCLAELGAAMPRAGGMYAYLARGFGPAWGFLYGWASSTVLETAANAAVAAGFIRLVGFLVPAANTSLFLLHIPVPLQAKTYEFAFTVVQPLAAGLIVVFTAINYLSVRSGGRIQLIATSLKVGALAALILLGLVSQRGNFANLLPGSASLAAGSASGFLTALVPVLWAYSGWYLLGAAGEEIENPGRNVPRAYVYGMLCVVAIYFLVNWVYLRVLPFSTVAQSAHVASDVFEMLVGKGGAKWLTIAMMISALGCLHACILADARIPYAMARDGLFFKFAKRVQPTFRSPSGGLLFFIGAVSALLALSGTYEDLCRWLFSSYGFSSLCPLSQLSGCEELSRACHGPTPLGATLGPQFFFCVAAWQ